jgi:hypothetical protein
MRSDLWSAVLVTAFVAMHGCRGGDQVGEGGTMRAGSNARLDAVAAALPDSIGSLRTRQPNVRYQRDTLFSSLNGAAELYLSFGFRELVVREYADETGSALAVEVYDMGSSADAFGVYRLDSAGEAVSIGQEARYSDGLLRFWRDRFFVRLLAGTDREQIKAQLVKAAGDLAESIGSDGPLPQLLCALDPGLWGDPETRFFHTDTCLALYFYLGSDNVLHLDAQTAVVLARPPHPVHRPQLLVIAYPTPEAAHGAVVELADMYGTDPQPADGFLVVERPGRVSAARRCGSFAILVFEASDPSHCSQLLDQTAARLEEVEW